MVKKIEHDKQILAIIVYASYHNNGIDFLTPGEYSQQLAYMHHPTGKKIDAHIHNEVHRSIHATQEVLIIKSGKLRVDFYDDNRKYIESHIIEGGDVILLVSGGHGFEVIEEIEMIEIKQGPYVGESDKVRFNGIETDEVNIK